MKHTPNNPEQYLFVYGTLRREFGHPQHQVIAQDARFVGMGYFAGILFDLGRYPGVIPASELNPAAWGGANAEPPRVTGEVYHLLRPTNLLEHLDRYEGCTSIFVGSTLETDGGARKGAESGDDNDDADEYRRELQEIQMQHQLSLHAWIYLYNLPKTIRQTLLQEDFSVAAGAHNPLLKRIWGGDYLQRDPA